MEWTTLIIERIATCIDVIEGLLEIQDSNKFRCPPMVGVERTKRT